MPDRPDTRTKHKHKFSALWGNFGEYGPPNQHYHVCLDDDCGEMLVGEGRDCDGDRASHDGRYRYPFAERDALRAALAPLLEEVE